MVAERKQLEQFFTYEEYLALEEKSDVKHEYINGQIRELNGGMYAMAGGSPEHAKVSFNVTVAVGKRLQGHRCRGASADQRVRIGKAETYTYPDLTVVCPPERYDEDDPNALLNPALLVEVLSPSTAAYDRGDKFAFYALIPELRDYILVSQERVQVEHFQRGEGDKDDTWILRRLTQREDVLPLPNLGIEIPLAEIYEGLDVPSGLRMLHQPSTPENAT